MSQTFTESSDSDSVRLNPNARRKVPFYGTLEKTQMVAQKENQNTLNRKAAVRQQEDEQARQRVDKARKKNQENKEQEENNQRLEEYVRKKKELEELLLAKALAEEEAGRAHRAAEQSQREKEQREQEKRDAKKRDTEAAKKRTNKASAAFKAEEEALYGPGRKLAEKRNQILDDESERAHKIAAQYREDVKNRPDDEVEDFDVYETYDKTISRKLVRTKESDFTKSHVHNPIVVSHADEAGPSGFEAAEAEMRKTEVRKMEFTTTRDDQRQKSLDRWHKAQEKEKSKRDIENFNREMERLQKAKNEIKINQGKQYPDMQTKPATNLLNKVRVQRESEQAFEDVFMKPDRKRQSDGDLPPKSFNAKKKSSLKNGTGKSYNFDSERSPQKSGFGSNTQRTNDEGVLTQTMREEEEEEDTYGSQEKADPNVFKSEALTVSGAVQSSGYEDSYENERQADRRYPQNLHESTSSMSSNPYGQQERKQQIEKPWKKAASKEPEVESYVPTKKPEPQRNVYQDEESPERSLEYSNQSSPAKEDVRSYGAVSFGERKPQSEWNTGHLETANLKPESLQRPFDYSYQQQQQKAKPAPPKEEEEEDEEEEEESVSSSSYGARKQGAGIVNKGRPDERARPQKDEVQEEIKGYIQEQEAFLKKYDNERQRLTDKLRASQASSSLSESTNKFNQRQERQERQDVAPKERTQQGARQKAVVRENDPDDEAIQELQKKAADLLSRFMQQPADNRDSESEEESESELMQSSQQYGQSNGQRYRQQNNFAESQSSTGYRREQRQEETPERNQRFNPRQQGFSSPSDLDYSVSDRDRSEKKSLAETMDYPKEYQNDYGQSFGQRRFNATETFGKRGDSTEKVQRQNREKPEQQKPWKMEFSMEDQKEEKAQRPNKEKPEQQKPWKMEFSTEDQAGNKRQRKPEPEEEEEEEVHGGEAKEPNLAELFKRNKKKMMEKYEHQRDQDIQREGPKEPKPTRSKEEMLQLRKAMMSYKGPKNPKAATQEVSSGNNATGAFSNPFATAKSGKDPNPELLDRLALGKKAKVNKKDMHALTSKNYELLPEVKKKKEQEQKKEEMKKRMENAKKLDQQRRDKSKSRTLSQNNGVPENIESYIQEQEAFLKKCENERQRLAQRLAYKEGVQTVRQLVLDRENDREDEAIEELQKKAANLLSRFMQQPIDSSDSDSEDELESEMQPSQQCNEFLL